MARGGAAQACWLLLPALVVSLSVLLHPSLSPIDPVAFVPPLAPPLEGVYAANDALLAAEPRFRGLVDGPEDVIADSQGNVLTANADGTLRKLWANGSMTIVLNTGGRPEGMAWLEEDKKLILCDAFKGLLLVHGDGSFEVLSASSSNLKFGLTDNVDVASDGSIYFSDATYKFNVHNYVLDALEARSHGRLLRHNLETSSTETLLDDLHFANGVALSADESFVLVAESNRVRIRRYYLKGPKAGTSDIFIDNLPGFPDNINRCKDGLFWVALFTGRDIKADAIGAFPFLKSLLARLPPRLWLDKPKGGMVLALNEDGSVAHFFMDQSQQHIPMLTTARRVGNELFFGTLAGNVVYAMKLNSDLDEVSLP